MNIAINSLMRGSISNQAASELLRIPITTLQKRVQAAHLQQEFQNCTLGEKSNSRVQYLVSQTFSMTQKKILVIYI